MKQIRSLLFVPAEEKRLLKIGKLDADAYVIDLEDSIPDSGKDEALDRTVSFLRSAEADNLYVRVNRNRYKHELEKLRLFRTGIMIPKIQKSTDYADMGAYSEGRDIIALIESPEAVINVNSIASVPWITALAFGAEDFTVAMNMKNSHENLLFTKTALLIAAKAYRKRVYDTPCFHIHDMETLKGELKQAVDLGFDGKLAIHPAQIHEINKAFKLFDREYMEYIITAYEEQGDAVCEIEGVVFEKLHIDRFRRLLSSDGYR